MHRYAWKYSIKHNNYQQRFLVLALAFTVWLSRDISDESRADDDRWGRDDVSRTLDQDHPSPEQVEKWWICRRLDTLVTRSTDSDPSFCHKNNLKLDSRFLLWSDITRIKWILWRTTRANFDKLFFQFCKILPNSQGLDSRKIFQMKIIFLMKTSWRKPEDSMTPIVVLICVFFEKNIPTNVKMYRYHNLNLNYLFSDSFEIIFQL